MKYRTNKQRLGLLLLALLLVSASTLFWWTYRITRQEQLNQDLIRAIQDNDTTAALSLLSQGADSNARPHSIDSRSVWRHLWDSLQGKRSLVKTNEPCALILALENTEREPPILIQALIEKGADVNTKDQDGCPALLLVTNRVFWHGKHDQYGEIFLDREDAKTLELLLRKGADINAKDKYGCTALMWASNRHEAELARFLLDKGADINAQCNDGETALIMAVEMNGIFTVPLLLDRGANTALKTHAGETALSYAKSDNLPDMVRMLKQAGATE